MKFQSGLNPKDTCPTNPDWLCTSFSTLNLLIVATSVLTVATAEDDCCTVAAGALVGRLIVTALLVLVTEDGVLVTGGQVTKSLAGAKIEDFGVSFSSWAFSASALVRDLV